MNTQRISWPWKGKCAMNLDAYAFLGLGEHFTQIIMLTSSSSSDPEFLSVSVLTHRGLRFGKFVHID